jgi:hypothetical protein
MNNVVGPPDVDLFHVLIALGSLTLVISGAGFFFGRRWHGGGEVDRTSWSQPQVLADQRWRVMTGLSLIAAWACIAVALIDHALQPAIASSLPSQLGPLVVPKWFAVAIHPSFANHGLTGLLMVTVAWSFTIDTPPLRPMVFRRRSFDLWRCFICLLALSCIFLNVSSVWS